MASSRDAVRPDVKDRPRSFGRSALTEEIKFHVLSSLSSVWDTYTDMTEVPFLTGPRHRTDTLLVTFVREGNTDVLSDRPRCNAIIRGPFRAPKVE